MPPKPIPTQPPSEQDNRLREKFQDAVAGQSDLMDKLGTPVISLSKKVLSLLMDGVVK